MSVIGVERHWLGPAVGAALITASLYAFTGGQQVILGRAVVAFVLILIVLLLPEGLVPAVLRRARGRRGRADDVAMAPILAAAGAREEAPATLHCRDGWGGSEEGRVGEEGRSRWGPDHLKKKKKNDA